MPQVPYGVDYHASRAITALRTPDPSLAAVANTVRQSIADVLEEQNRKINKFGLALMMIREGCADPREVAAKALKPKSP